MKYLIEDVIQMVTNVCNNTRDLETGEVIKVPTERNKDFIDAIINLGKQVPLEYIEKKLEDIIRLSQIQTRPEQENADKAEVRDVVRVISEGMNDNRQITFVSESNPEEVKSGFLKSNLIPVFNDATLAMEKMGTLLGVPMAKTYITEFEAKKFVISENVGQNGKQFLTMQQFNARYGQEWEHPSSLEEKIANQIQYQIQSVENSGASKEDCDKFREDYIRMICFDYITNQTDRNDGNYGVLISQNGEVSLAPIFDSDYILNDPSTPEYSNSFSLNKKYDKDEALRILVGLYPKETRDSLDLLGKKENELIGIAEAYLSEDMLNGKGNYREILSNNIQKFREIVLSRTQGLEDSKHITMEDVVRNAIGKRITREDVNRLNAVEQRSTEEIGEKSDD